MTGSLNPNRYNGFHIGKGDSSNEFTLELLMQGQDCNTHPVALHIARADDACTDWNVAANTHPTVYIHSATTPATDYISLVTDATCATINAQGATNLNFQISGTTNLRVASGNVTLLCGADLTFTGTTGQSSIFLTDNLADSLSVLISGGSDFLVFKTTNCSEVLSSAVDNKLTGGNMIMTKRTVTTDATVGNNTWTIAEMLGGLLLRDAAGGARSDVTPTAAAIVAGIPCATADDTFEVTIVNTADMAEAITLTAGTDVTLIPASLVFTQDEQLHLIVRLVDVGACEAVTMYGAVSAGT